MCVCVCVCVCVWWCWFADRVQPSVATLQHSYAHQDVHRRVNACGLGRPGAQGCQLVREGGESQPARPACKIHYRVYLVPAFFTVTQTKLRFCVCVSAGVGHVWCVLRQPPRPEAYSDRLRLRRSPVQEGLPSLRIRRGELCQRHVRSA